MISPANLKDDVVTGFQLHPRLVADCHIVGRLTVCHLLLHRNALVPWYILVPETEVSELHLLPQPLRTQVRDGMDALVGFVKRYHGCRHSNVAAIGNVVPQLHLHVIGRNPGDACWPDVVWGNLPDGPARTEEELTDIREALDNDALILFSRQRE